MAKETIIQTALSNGLRVRLKRQPYQRTLTIGLFIKHGAQHEDIHTNGAAHYVEHVLFNPNHMHSEPRDLLNSLLDRGVSYEAYTSKEYTRFTLTGTPSLVEAIMRFIGLLVSTSSHISRAAVEHERPIILQEHAMVFSSGKILRELLDNALWGDHSLGLYVIGRKENIARFDREDLEGQLQTHYVPEKATLVVLGDIELDLLDRLISCNLEPWTDRSSPSIDPVTVVEPRVIALPTGGNRADLLIGYPGMPFNSSDRFAMELLADILGGGMKSRLFTELRERQRKVYAVHAYPVSYGLGGYLAIQVNCDRSDIADVFSAIQQELNKLITDGIREDELSRAKATRITALLGVLENSAQHVQIFGRRAILNDDFYVDLEARHLNGVRSDEVMRVAIAILKPDNLALVGLGPTQQDLLSLV